MKFPMHLNQPFRVDMRIALRGGQIGMTKELLHRTQIGAAFQQMRGETMTQQMRLDGFGDPCAQARIMHQLP